MSFLLKRHIATSSRPGYVISVETSYCNIFTSWFCRFCWNVILQHLHVLVLSFLLKGDIAHLYVLVLSFLLKHHIAHLYVLVLSFLLKRHIAHLYVLVLSFLLKRHIAHLYVLVLSSLFPPECSICSVCFLEIFTWEVFCEVLLWGNGQVECSSAFKGFVSLSVLKERERKIRGLFQAMCFIQNIHERNPLHSGWV